MLLSETRAMSFRCRRLMATCVLASMAVVFRLQGSTTFSCNLQRNAWTRHQPSRGLVRLSATEAELEAIEAIEALEEAEEEDDIATARELAASEELAEVVALTAVKQAEDISAEMSRTQRALALARDARRKELQNARVIPSGPVFDLQSLADKYGGTEQIWNDHQVAARAGFFTELSGLREFLNLEIDDHNRTAYDSFVEFEHARGSRLVLVGVNHLSRASADLSQQVVEREKPECLVLENRLGDDSLQRLTVPERLFQELAMSKAPSDLMTSDTPVDRARKFQADKIWLEASAGWKDIAGEAAAGHEFGLAFEEFARQRLNGTDKKGPRGGTLILGDSDLRPVYRPEEDAKLRPPTNQLSSRACQPIRDLQLSRAMRLALRTHGSVVGIVGKDHIRGITRLLKQDKEIRVVKQGIPIEQPPWSKELQDGGRQWEMDALGGNKLFMRLADSIELSPFGTFIDAAAVLQLKAWKDENEERLKKDGVDAEPVSPVSSTIGADFFEKSIAATPRTESELRRWLAGERLEDQVAGDFPYENRLLRTRAPPVPQFLDYGEETESFSETE